jgi:hypothetical protein
LLVSPGNPVIVPPVGAEIVLTCIVVVVLLAEETYTFPPKAFTARILPVGLAEVDPLEYMPPCSPI